jgi:prophage regulatory protein
VSPNGDFPIGARAAPMPFIWQPDVEARVGLKRSAIYLRMSEGRFPKSRSLGIRCTVWLESEILQWMVDQANR